MRQVWRTAVPIKFLLVVLPVLSCKWLEAYVSDKQGSFCGRSLDAFLQPVRDFLGKYEDRFINPVDFAYERRGLRVECDFELPIDDVLFLDAFQDN